MTFRKVLKCDVMKKFDAVKCDVIKFIVLELLMLTALPKRTA